jgi:hypothetical protein
MQIDLKNCTITISDGSTPAETLEVKIGEGNLTYTETINRKYVKDRGILDTVVNEDEEPVSVSLDFMWEFLKASTSEDPSIEDALKNEGEASAWVTSDTGDPCAPYAVDVTIVHDPPCGDEEIETIVLSNFRYESLNHDSKGGSVAVSGKCNITKATITRSAQTT